MDSASGFVSSYRKMVSLFSLATPSFSNASSKFMFIDLACPMCRYPFGSGGKRVLVIAPTILRCSSSSSALFTPDGSSRPCKALEEPAPVASEATTATAASLVVAMTKSEIRYFYTSNSAIVFTGQTMFRSATAIPT
jgi:hypothetical protein